MTFFAFLRSRAWVVRTQTVNSPPGNQSGPLLICGVSVLASGC
jgi:hypothetical protein